MIDFNRSPWYVFKKLPISIKKELNTSDNKVDWNIISHLVFLNIIVGFSLNYLLDFVQQNIDKFNKFSQNIHLSYTKKTTYGNNQRC